MGKESFGHDSTEGLCEALLNALKRCLDHPDTYRNALNHNLPENDDVKEFCRPMLQSLERRKCTEVAIAMDYYRTGDR